MKAEKIFSRRKGFSLIELFIAMIIIAIFTSFISVNITSQSQTAKAEAEKLAAYITGLTRKADRRHMGFTINFDDTNNTKTVYWGNNSTPSEEYIYKKNPASTDKVILAPGFLISHDLSKQTLTYDSNSNEFSNSGKIIITKSLASDKDNDKYHYIHIRRGRVRASESQTDLGADEE